MRNNHVTRSLIIAGIGLIAVLFAVGLHISQRDSNAPVPVATPERPAGQSAPKSQPADVRDEPILPSFDVVRINREGNTVIAGRAEPKSEVFILDDGREIGRVVADNRGEWVFVPDRPLGAGTRGLTLRAVGPDGSVRESEGPVVVMVPENPGIGEGPLVLKSTKSGSVVFQDPRAGRPPETDLAIGVVDHDQKGNVLLAGKAPPNGSVNLYVDDAFVGKLQADENGQWRARLKDPVSGTPHRLRADQVDPSGKVLSRAEVAFTPTQVAVPAGGKVLVERGASLWRIARETYGSGLNYTVIYEANRGQIRDPDLIYPGQVFIVPMR